MSDINIKINGGDDATNQTLISWLDNNGILTAPVAAIKKLLKINSKVVSKVNNKYIGAFNDEIIVPGTNSRPQLSPPTNLAASGTTISFDEVDGAESYEVFVDGTSIGEYTPVSGYTITLTYIKDNTNIRVYLNGDTEYQVFNAGETKVYTGINKIKIESYGGTVVLTNQTGSLVNYEGYSELEINGNGSATVNWANIG